MSGYIVKKNKGRLISDEGMKRIDRVATELYKEIIKTSEGLQRYA
jgi:small subunit ribosomal protein S19e